LFLLKIYNRFWAENCRFAFALRAKKDWLVWKLLENSFAEARGEAPSEAGNRNFTNWLSVLNKIRTFFKENPDAEF